MHHDPHGPDGCPASPPRRRPTVGDAVKFNDRAAFVAYEYAGDRVAIRFGTPERWQGEIVVDVRDLDWPSGFEPTAYQLYRRMPWTTDHDECEAACGRVMAEGRYVEGRFGNYCSAACRDESRPSEDRREDFHADG